MPQFQSCVICVKEDLFHNWVIRFQTKHKTIGCESKAFQLLRFVCDSELGLYLRIPTGDRHEESNVAQGPIRSSLGPFLPKPLSPSGSAGSRRQMCSFCWINHQRSASKQNPCMTSTDAVGEKYVAGIALGLDCVKARLTHTVWYYRIQPLDVTFLNNSSMFESFRHSHFPFIR